MFNSFNFPRSIQRLISMTSLLMAIASWHIGSAQVHADKSYYLVDSLDLMKLDSLDLELLDRELSVYHNSSSDTAALEAIGRIISGMANPAWIKYNRILLRSCNALLSENDHTSRERIVFNQGKAVALTNFGYYFNDRGKPERAIANYQHAIKIYSNLADTSGLLIALGNLAYVYDAQGDTYSASEIDERRMRLAVAFGDTSLLVDIHNSIGYSLQVQEYYELANVQFELSLNLAEKNQMYSSMAIAHNNIGFSYLKLDQDSLAMQHFQQAIALKKFGHGSAANVAATLCNMASVLKYQLSIAISSGEDAGMLSDSIESVLRQAVEEGKRSGEIKSLVTPYNSFSDYFMLIDNPKVALLYADSAYQIAKQGGYIDEIQESAKTMFYSLYEMGRWKDALDMHIEWKDKLEEQRNIENAETALASRYKISFETQATADSVKYAEQKKLGLKELELKETQLSAGRTQRWFLFGGIVLVAVFGVFMYRRFKTSQRQKAQIAEQKSHIEEVHQEIRDSINYAKRLQSAILPSREQMIANIRDGFVLFLPKDVVSGDFYWMHVNGEMVWLAVADCTGHGVPGAMVSVVCSNALNRAVKEFDLTSPGAILDKTRELVIDTFSRSGADVKDGMDISLCRIDKSQRELTFAGANNPAWLVRKNADFDSELVLYEYSLLEFRPDKQPVGLYDAAKPFNEQKIKLLKDDCIYLFSDGYADQFGGEKGKKLKYKNLKEILLRTIGESMNDQLDKVQHEFILWRGKFEQIDDVCIIGIQI